MLISSNKIPSKLQVNMEKENTENKNEVPSKRRDITIMGTGATHGAINFGS